MKKRLLFVCAVLATFSLMAFSYMNWSNHSTDHEVKPYSATYIPEYYFVNLNNKQADPDFFYEVDSRFLKTITKTDLQNAKTVSDIFSDNEIKGIESFRDVNIVILPRNEDKFEKGDSNEFNSAQLNLLRSTDYSTNICIEAFCNRKISETGKIEEQCFVYYITIVPEKEYVMSNVHYLSGKLIVQYLKDAISFVSVYNLSGEKLYDLDLPGVGTISGFKGKRDDKEVFYSFTSYTQPPTIYKYDVVNNKSTLFKKSALKFDMENIVTEQVFYPGKDGTKIPLFITYKKGLNLKNNNPALLYGYGGFKATMVPKFRLTIIPLLENGFIFCVAGLRGGNEYGEKWHKAGMLENKQNVFDDFIYAAKYLFDKGYSSPEKIGVYGVSNGGLLVGACMTQEPELFKVAIPLVGVLDMLRYHQFTIGHAWAVEYGSSDDKSQFEYLYKYSPLHNIKTGTKYPATLITTADHDDRVFPAHSFKFAATVQEKAVRDNPVIIRIETETGHGIDTTSKIIALYTDLWSFLMYNTGVDFK